VSKPVPLVVQMFHKRAADALHRLSKELLPGAKLTLLVRRPEAPDGSQDILITDDETSEAIRALEIRRTEEQKTIDPMTGRPW